MKNTIYASKDLIKKYRWNSILMDEYIEQNGYVNDINASRLHHEIYLSDVRKVLPEKWKTVIRHPIKNK